MPSSLSCRSYFVRCRDANVDLCACLANRHLAFVEQLSQFEALSRCQSSTTLGRRAAVCFRASEHSWSHCFQFHSVFFWFFWINLSPGSKRSYVDWLVGNHPSLRPFADVLAAARDVFLRLRQVNVTVDALSNLATGTYMWPTSVAKPRKRGEVDRFFGPSQGQFVMMGRGFVRGVVEAMGGDDPAKRIFLYGPQGVGKSHILAAVALFCSVRRAKGDVGAPPVCYIPDMKEALADSKYLFKCLVQAFIDQPDVLVKIVDIGMNVDESFNLPALVGWSRARSGVVFIADQCNEVGNTQEPEDKALNKMVEGVGAENWLLFAASSNQTKVDVFTFGSTGGDKALKMLVGKFSYEEYCEFVRANFSVHAPFLVATPRPPRTPAGQEPALIDLIEEVTGFLPLQVYQLCLAVADGLQNRKQGYSMSGTVQESIQNLSANFTADALNKLNLGFFKAGIEIPKYAIRNASAYAPPLYVDLETKVEMMTKAVGSTTSFRNGLQGALGVDWRFFYPEGHDMVAVAVSELIRVAAVSAVVDFASKLDLEKQKKYFKSLSSAMGLNASVKGFVLEAVVNGCLSFCKWDDPTQPFNGFGFPGWPSQAGKVDYFGINGYVCKGDDFDATLLIPTVWRYPLVDSVIVYQHNNHCYVVGIQITTRTPVQHAHSIAFVTDPLSHLKFVPPGFWAGGGQPARFTVALLWIVHQEDVDTLPPVNVGVHQAAIPLQHFQTVCGVPIPSR